MADWTVAVAVFTGFLALASIIGDAFSFWALRTINGQLEEMRKQSDIAYVDERPWIGAPIITIAQGAKGELTFLFKFKNVGKTPTTGLFITAAFSTENNWKIDVHHQCEWAKNYVSDGGKKDFELYSIVPQGTGLVSGERIASVQESNAPTFTDFTGKDYQDIRKGGTIVGCVIYNAFSDPPPYKETGFVGWVKSIGGHLEVPNISVIDPK